MKKLILLSILTISFSANSEVIKGLDLDQEYKCIVSKVYSQPIDYRTNKPHNIKVGEELVLERQDNTTIMGLINDTPFNVGAYDQWFYSRLRRWGPKFEKQCKTPCLIYFTDRGGRWVFHPQMDGTMNAFLDSAVHPDLNSGARMLGFKCSKVSRR